ncbi:MAG: hypothetical protein EP330_10110 [Deltaproteobacteria bacterium]|nr:MAG: hypothetical protein EP330_10110 [Deltaproteobacteria bacterium]
MTVDRFELELYALGDLDDPDRVAAVEAAIAGPMAEEWRALNAARDAWTAPPLALPEPVAAPSPTWGVWRALALAAALLLAVLGPLSLRPEPEGVRAMGQLPVDAFVERSGAQLGHLRAGDVLGVRTTLPRAGVVAIGLLQPREQGAALLWVSEPAEAGAEVAIPAGLELDDYTGEEWLVISVHAATPTEEDWAVNARRLVQSQSSEGPARAVLLRGRR